MLNQINCYLWIIYFPLPFPLRFTYILLLLTLGLRVFRFISLFSNQSFCGLPHSWNCLRETFPSRTDRRHTHKPLKEQKRGHFKLFGVFSREGLFCWPMEIHCKHDPFAAMHSKFTVDFHFRRTAVKCLISIRVLRILFPPPILIFLSEL